MHVVHSLGFAMGVGFGGFYLTSKGEEGEEGEPSGARDMYYS